MYESSDTEPETPAPIQVTPQSAFLSALSIDLNAGLTEAQLLSVGSDVCGAYQLGGRQPWMTNRAFEFTQTTYGQRMIMSAIDNLCPPDRLSWLVNPLRPGVVSQLDPMWKGWFGGRKVSRFQLWKEISMGFVGSELSDYYQRDPASYALAVTLMRQLTTS